MIMILVTSASHGDLLQRETTWIDDKCLYRIKSFLISVSLCDVPEIRDLIIISGGWMDGNMVTIRGLDSLAGHAPVPTEISPALDTLHNFTHNYRC